MLSRTLTATDTDHSQQKRFIFQTLNLNVSHPKTQEELFYQWVRETGEKNKKEHTRVHLYLIVYVLWYYIDSVTSPMCINICYIYIIVYGLLAQWGKRQTRLQKVAG